jgi:cellulose synthase/poly-beta-1,6-N-acetylglucosamine synthase-like glycosyltransferase
MLGLLILVFLFCMVMILYVYVFYPALIFVLSKRFGVLADPPDLAVVNLPKISLLFAAYNEEFVLAERLENALAMDYPAERLEIVVGSDGSDDRTVEVANRFVDRGVRVIDFAERSGKAVVLNRAMPELSGEIVLLSDANTMIAPDAARKLVRWFASPDVSCVCGRLVLTDPITGKNADGLYWKYETFLKKCEARLGALLGANGAIYAIRRERYVPIPPGTIVDDFVIPLLSKLRKGGTIGYDSQALAFEESAADLNAEFGRRCRIGAGGFQSLSLLWPLLDPRKGFLMGMLASNLILILSADPAWRWVMIGQIAFYTVSLLAPASPSRWLRPLRLASMFTSMNIALLVGFWQWLTGRRGGIWTPTARPIRLEEVNR